mmetsp:Transcript_26955/g.58903  ORF Transcript_26955/g.58903 Transcript_26955/m.58903 type:complete len:850 (+) Transcript_26955:117-2666(+)|eukprot:CAMPEP_0202891082 /NCGR_PEP_ID=MMETSP1392-20130828/1259_1 /ASSEMBLY_ACC=CAM_ASM_000868 /TAXON_ID=225041 /ORGANISM="Chlamydomonas chlamydogama, Strain SAG 11-48b" /LENGTH=849 /DNA_ID=CAMNT_0049574757 /DNA_START=71 /DNA_END=2620 /DNA_ORIENTATION=-
MASGIDADWQSLLHQTQDLVTQDHHSFPKVARNIVQLQQYAESLRARTNKFRTLNNQIAATRLLAQQGFDATRLTQDVTALEIQPTIEDVFHADTTSVEDYLKQVEESTLLAAIQEAQQDTVSSFESYMEDCMARDWAANKKQLFGLIAPHSATPGFSAAVASPMLGITRPSASGLPGLPGAPSIQLPPKEQAYVDVIKRANEAAASGNQNFDLVKELGAACKANEDKSHETTMSSCWTLLSDILAEARARGVASSPVNKFAEALVQGARKHLERFHAVHTRNTVLRHKLQAERGADPEQVREVQAYIQVKYGSSGALDFQQPGGHDTSWMQVYFCLRNGWHDAARRAAERTHDVSMARLGEAGFKGLLDEWLRSSGRLSDRSAALLARECERLLRDKAALKGQIRYPYMVLLCALLAGDNRAVDALSATLNSLSVPPVLSTIEDFMWAKLSLVSTTAGLGQQGPSGMGMYSSVSVVPPYTLAELHADLNRWPAAYYSKQGKEPLLYVTVLLLSLQFQEALQFLWKDETTKMYRVDAVHMAIAMHQEQALAVNPGDSGLDIGGMIHSYSRKFVHVDSAVALQYYMLAAVVRGNSIAVKGQMLRELLTESRDFGTLLGGGGALGSAGGALRVYVPDPEERKRLFEAVAYECQVAAQPEEAIELYMAADRPRQALAILNQQLSNVIVGAVDEAVSGISTTAANDTAKHILTRGRDACTKIGPSADAGSRREVEAFEQLNMVWELLLACRKGRHDLALQKLHELSFIPLEKSRVEGCIRAAQQLHPAVQERLQDILSAAADTINAQRAGAGREKLFTLRCELDALCVFANSVPHRVSKLVYQKLCEVAASFS